MRRVRRIGRSAHLQRDMQDKLFGHRRIIIPATVVFFLGLAVRLLLLVLLHTEPEAPPEPVKIAISLATTGKYADAYGTGVGPTAHCAPLHPLLLSGLLRIFGTNEAGRFSIKVAASTGSALVFALLPLLAFASGLNPIAGVLAGAAGAVLPFNFWPQTSGVFDAPFTAVVLVGLCILVCRIWARGTLTMREGVILGTAAGLGSLLNPAILPVLAAWLITIAVENRRRARQVLLLWGACAACLIWTLTPWAVRNLRVLGSLIWTRSNFWLEMHVSNNDWLTADEERNERMPEFALVHPYLGAVEKAKVKKLGEVAYMRLKRREAIAWVGGHKRKFLVLTAERVRLFWLPRMTRPLQTLLEALLTILGLGGLVLLFRQRARSAWLFAGIFVAYPAVYYIIQVSPRYRLPIEPFLFLLAAHLVWTFTANSRVQLRERHARNVEAFSGASTP